MLVDGWGNYANTVVCSLNERDDEKKADHSPADSERANLHKHIIHIWRLVVDVLSVLLTRITNVQTQSRNQRLKQKSHWSLEHPDVVRALFALFALSISTVCMHNASVAVA